MFRMGLSFVLLLGACGPVRDASFERAGLFRFKPAESPPTAFFALTAASATAPFKESVVELAWRDDYPSTVLLQNRYAAREDCGYQTDVRLERVSTLSGDSVVAERSDGGLLVTAKGIGTTTLRQEGTMPCGPNDRRIDFTHEVRVNVEAVRGFELAAFPGCEAAAIPSGVLTSAPPVFVLGSEGGRFIAANGRLPPGFFVRAPNGFREGPNGSLEFAAGRVDWGVEGEAPVTGVLRTNVVGPDQVVSAKPTWSTVVELGRRMGAVKTKLPSASPTPVEEATSARIELQLEELSTSLGPLCPTWPASWLEVNVESGPCLANSPPLALSGGAWVANFTGYGRCVVSVGVRRSPTARWTVDATIAPP